VLGAEDPSASGCSAACKTGPPLDRTKQRDSQGPADGAGYRVEGSRPVRPSTGRRWISRTERTGPPSAWPGTSPPCCRR